MDGMRSPVLRLFGGCQQESDIKNNNQNVEMPNEMVYAEFYFGTQVHCLFIVTFLTSHIFV